MGIINQNANLYNKRGELVCKAGNYPKNIIIQTIGIKSYKQNASWIRPMDLAKRK